MYQLSWPAGRTHSKTESTQIIQFVYRCTQKWIVTGKNACWTQQTVASVVELTVHRMSKAGVAYWIVTVVQVEVVVQTVVAAGGHSLS